MISEETIRLTGATHPQQLLGQVVGVAVATPTVDAPAGFHLVWFGVRQQEGAAR